MTDPAPTVAGPVLGGATPPAGPASGAEGVSLTPLPARAIVVLVLSTFGAALALLVPMVYTLALRLDAIAPGNQGALGFILGAGALGSLLSGPLIGVLSDRTRTRWGRRRPFVVAGSAIGLASVPILTYAPNPAVLAVGWVVASLGWGSVMGSIANYQADRLPPQQRGKVAGLTGMTSYVAPIVGILLVGPFTASTLLVFTLPVVVGGSLVVLFLVFAREEDTRGMPVTPLSFGAVLRGYGFRPRSHPEFAWNWLGRFSFFSGLALTTAYGTFLYASRLGIGVDELAPTLAAISAVGVAAALVGSGLGGVLSDRWARRRPFVAVGVLVYASGAVILASAHTLTGLVVGNLCSSLGVAIFLTVNQAMVLDILPHRATQAGRYMAIAGFSQSIPTAVAPLAAPFLLAIGSTGEANYAALYLAAAALAVVGAIIVLTRVRSVR